MSIEQYPPNCLSDDGCGEFDPVLESILYEVLEQADLTGNEALRFDPRSRYLELNDGRQICWVFDTFYFHDEIPVHLAVGELRYALGLGRCDSSNH